MSFFFTPIYLFFSLSINPFLFEVPDEFAEENKYYKQLEENIQKANISTCIESLFREEKKNFKLTQKELEEVKTHLSKRVFRGVDQRFTADNLAKCLIKINKGSSCCVVTTVDGSNLRNPELIQQSIKNLEALGFNGYFYYRIGGFPNPTGQEIRYAALPYSFKIFLMLEASKLGFSHVLWVDSRLIPIRSIDPIFDVIKKHHAFLIKDKVMVRANFLSPALEKLTELTDLNPLIQYRITTPIFGLDFSFAPTVQVVNSYYKCCESGLPFLSVFPEEHVLSCIFSKYKNAFPYTDNLYPSKFKNLWLYDEDISLKNSLKFAKKKQFFFFGLSNKSQFHLTDLFFQKKRCP
jgi:hypothetical protein